jgi:hypothetical protein
MFILDLFARIGLKTDKNELKAFAAGLKEVQKGLLRTVGLTMGAAGAAVALKKITSGAMETAVALTQMSRKVGMSVEQLQAIQGSVVIVSNSDIQRINQANREMYKFQTTLKSLSMIVGGEIAVALGEMAKQFNDWIKNNPGAIKSIRMLGVAIAGILRGIGATVSMIGRMIGAIWDLGSAGKALIGVIALIGAAIMMTPVGWITAALMALFLIIDDIVGYTQGKDSVFGDLLGNEDFANAINSIIQPLQDLWETFRQFFSFLQDSGIIKFFVDLGGIIIKYLVGTLQTAASALGNIIDLIVKLIHGDRAGAWKAVKDIGNDMKNGFNNNKEFIGGLASTAFEGAKNISANTGDAWQRNMMPLSEDPTPILPPSTGNRNVSNIVNITNNNTGIPEKVAERATTQTATEVDNSMLRFAAGQQLAGV